MTPEKQGPSDCFLCQQSLQLGPFGHYFETLDLSLCGKCIDGTRDGFPHEHEGRLIRHLESRGKKPPDRNPSGRFKL